MRGDLKTNKQEMRLLRPLARAHNDGSLVKCWPRGANVKKFPGASKGRAIHDHRPQSDVVFFFFGFKIPAGTFCCRTRSLNFLSVPSCTWGGKNFRSFASKTKAGSLTT